MIERTSTGIDPNAEARRASVWWAFLGCGGLIVALMATCTVFVATASTGRTESIAARKSVFPGMAWPHFVRVIEATPKTRFWCSTPMDGRVPPCRQGRVVSDGD